MVKKKHTVETLYQNPLDPVDQWTDPDPIYDVQIKALNPKTWRRDRIDRKARRMYKGKDADDIQSYNPEVNAANALLVRRYNHYKEKDRVKQLKKEGKPVGQDLSFRDLLKVHVLNSGSMDNPHPTPYLVDPATQAKVLKYGTEEDAANMFAVQNEYDKQMDASKAATAASALGAGTGFVTAGVLPTLVSTATGTALSYAGGMAGEKLDEQFGTKWISPTLSTIGGLYGGYKGYQVAKPLLLPYLTRYPLQNGVLVTKEFAIDAVADALSRNVKNTVLSKSVYPTWERVYGDPSRVQLIRRLGEVPEIDADGNVILVPEDNLFANFTTDLPFRRHSAYTTQHPHAIHFDATKVGNARPISTHPSDTFFLNGDIKIKPSDVTFVSGDPSALSLAESRGFKIQPIAELTYAQPQQNIVNRVNLTKNGIGDTNIPVTKIFDDYFESMRPTAGDYKALGIRWGTEIPVQAHTAENSSMFGYLTNIKDPLNFKHVIYHPAHSAESDFVHSVGIKQLFDNHHLKLGQHPRYELPIDRETAKGLVRAYIKDSPYQNKEYFTSLSEGEWDDLFFSLRNKLDGDKPLYIDKLQILRDNHARATAEKTGWTLSRNADGNFIFTNPKTGKSVLKLSAPITSADNSNPFWTTIRLGIRDNLNSPDPRYVLFPAAIATGAALENNQDNKNPYEQKWHK